MDALNLLKFWRNPGSVFVSDVRIDCKKKGDHVSNQGMQIDNETDDDDSFFELVLAAPDCQDDCSEKRVKAGFSFVDSPKDVFSNKKVFPVDANESKPQSPIALLKSAPKFRVFMLGLKKSKLEKTETNGGDFTATPKPEQLNRKCSDKGRSKRFAVKCRFEEVPAVPLFTRDNSLRSKLQRDSVDEFSIDKASSKRFEKDDVPKYLKLIKPLYDRAPKKHGEKTRFSYQLSAASPMSSPATMSFTSPRKASEEKPVNNRAASLKVVYRHLGKSRSTSSSGMTPSPVNRRDDSLLQQHDGIQSAILHCKRSYNSSESECSALWRCSSHASHDQQRDDDTLELKRCSI